jgi:RNA polymerase sigma factor (sigma-70 family)
MGDDRRERFERVYDDNYQRILGYALRRTDTAEDALDVVAETFLAAWRRLDDIPSGDRAKLWLYGTARKVLANHHRGHHRRQRLTERLQADLPRLPDAHAPAAAQSPDGDAIVAAFAVLRPDDRDLLILVGWEGLDAGEIAEVLGCSRANARVRLHRARRRFTTALARHGVQRDGAGGHERGGWASAHPGGEEGR